MDKKTLVYLILIIVTCLLCLITLPVLEALRAILGGVAAFWLFYGFFLAASRLFGNTAADRGLIGPRALFVFSRVAGVLFAVAYLLSVGLILAGFPSHTTCTIALGVLGGVGRYTQRT